MGKIIIFLPICLLIIISCSNVKKYNVNDKTPTNIITLNDSTACVCFFLDDYKKDTIFYILETCDDKNSKIDKILHYNFIESCDYKDTCDDVYLNKYSDNYDKDFEIESVNGFRHQYKFKIEDENKKAILLYYKKFIGKEFNMSIGGSTRRMALIIVISIFAGILIFVDAIIILESACKSR